MEQNEVVVVIDFGSPYNQMLTRNIRALGVYSELRAHTVSFEEIEQLNPKAIVLSGGPYYVDDEHQYRVDERILTSGIPILGICYGMQLLTDFYGGNVTHQSERT